MTRGARLLGCLLLAAAVVLLSRPAASQVGSYRYASIIVEARTGAVLSAVNPDEPRHPASLTKMMTLYMVFEALRDRRISLNQLVPVSATAAAMSPTKLGLAPGARLTVEEAILGLVTRSANDAAAALGEMLGGGDETRFAQMMTLRARALGMSRTTFRNASGLPDPAQITTARDMALLGRRLVADFPAYYGYFSAPSFTFRGRTFRNHDRLLELYPGTDGLKTGYTRDSGYNLVSSAARGGVRLVGVVLGGASGGERDRHMMNLLDDGFEKADVPIARRETPPAGLRVPALIASAHAAPAGRGRAAAAPAVRFGIQAGAYPTQPEARKAALVAQRLADGGQIRLEAAAATPRKGRKPGKAAATLWRAQVTGLTATEAQAACAALARRKLPCMVLKPDSGQLASR